MAALQEIKVPLLAVNDATLTIVELCFEYGAKVSKGDIVMVLETSKTTFDVEAEADGYVQYNCELGGEYAVNETIAAIVSDKDEVIFPPLLEGAMPESINNNEGLPDGATFWEGQPVFSDEARRLIEERQIDISIFRGKDFVSRPDVDRLLSGKRAPLSSKIDSPKAEFSMDIDKVVIHQLSRNKKREIKYLEAVQGSGLTSTVSVFVNTAGIYTHLNSKLRYLDSSLLPVIVYEVSRLLRKYSSLNAYYNGDSIAFYKEVGVGFAIDIEKGLKVLKIPEVATGDISNIEDAILSLSNKYLDDTLEVDDLTDITFTITDLSAEGVAFFKPLVNMFNSAILGVSSIDEKLGRCVLSLTFDHRVTEGKDVARFLQELKERLESYRPVSGGALILKDVACFKCFKKLQEDLSDVGFVKCITPEGIEAYICQSCLKGF